MCDNEDGWVCKDCGESVYLGDGCERPEHGLCWQCSSDAVSTLTSKVADLELRLDQLLGWIIAGVIPVANPEDWIIAGVIPVANPEDDD